MNKKIRLNKALSSSGIAARRKCEELIFAGKVAVNGQVTLLPQTMVDPHSDQITVEGKAISSQSRKVYYILNKPPGYQCTHLKKNPRTKVVLDLFGNSPFRLFTAGRLDRDTTGLLIVTNDGDFANKVIHPSSQISKSYIAKTQHEITPEHLQIISQGCVIENVFVKPIKVVKIRKGTVKVVVSEGKKREVRLLLENAGLTVRELSRISIGNLHMGNLPLGHWKELSPSEMKAIFE